MALVSNWMDFQSATVVGNGESLCTGPAQAGWSSAASALAAGGGEASIAHGFGNPFDGDSNFLRVTGLAATDAELPHGIVVLGIEIRAKKRYTTTNNSSVADCHAHLVKDFVIQAGDRPVGGAWPNNYVTHGGAADLWGSAWTREDLVASGFGFVLASHWVGPVGANNGFVDHIQARVHYEPRGFFMTL